MRPLPRRTPLLIAAGVALSACSERPSEPTVPSQIRPSFASGTITPVCDAVSLRADAKLIFAKSNDPVYKIITDLGKNPTTDRAFDGLSALSAVRGTSSQASTATEGVFDHLAKGFLGCADATITQPVGAVDFAPLFSPTKLFEVRGKAGTDPDGPSGGAYQKGGVNPYWGVESPAKNWGTTLSALTTKRILFYEVPPTDFLTTSGKIGSATDIRTIPVLADGQITVNVGLCNIFFAPNTSFPGARRVNHENIYQAYLQPSCSRGQSQLSASMGSPFDPRVLAQRVVDFFAPRPLNAAVTALLGGVGTGLKGLSPVGVYDLSQIVLGSLDSVKNGNNTTVLKVTPGNVTYADSLVVRATDTTTAHTPLVGIPIEMSIQGNSSNIAFFGVGTETVPTVIRTTDSNGFANFGDVKLTKAGGYTLSFRVHFIAKNEQGVVIDEVTGATTLLSNPFNIQNK